MSSSDGIQFDRAEFETGAAPTACAECHSPLAGYYYDVNGQTVCERCRYAIENRFTSGSRLGRFVRATGFGLIAAAIGFGIYYGIVRLTGYEFGLIAIVVGFMVGIAVRIGSNGRGGWVYQGLAIVLTYLAIVSMYIPPIIQGIREMRQKEEAGVVQVSDTTRAGADDNDPTSAAVMKLPRAVRWIIGSALIVGLACAAPFLMGFQNVIGWVIIAIGLYQAWSLNRRGQLVITGPHTIQAAPAPAGA